MFKRLVSKVMYGMKLEQCNEADGNQATIYNATIAQANEVQLRCW